MKRLGLLVVALVLGAVLIPSPNMSVSVGETGAESDAGGGAEGAADPARDNPDAFFFDDFETGTVEKWDNDDLDFEDQDLQVVEDASLAHSGSYCLQITANEGEEGAGGKLPKWFLPGEDEVYIRWYCKFAPDFDQGNHMHVTHILGGPPDNKWAAFGKAGIKPTGYDHFTTEFIPWRDWGRHDPPGAMAFYTYYPDMKPSPDGRYWGNMFHTDPPFVLERDRWYCIEVHIKLNTPGQIDGLQEVWIDGEKVCRFEDIRWRETDKLKVHCFWLLLYVHKSPRINRIYFDDVAISSSYIGPIGEG